jgi:arylsulfatase A-like enzyme
MDYLDDPMRITPRQYQMAEKAYDGCIAYLDQQLGRLLQELRERGDLDNTLVIVTSDHGEEFGEHGEYLHGTSLYQQQTHVPLLLHFPGRVPGGVRIRETVSLRDLPATVTDVLGMTSHRFPGESLARLWDGSPRGGESVVAAPVLSELEPFWHDIPPTSSVAKGPIRAIWSGNRKYIHRDKETVEELYNLAEDSLERHNLALQTGQRSAVA